MFLEGRGTWGLLDGTLFRLFRQVAAIIVSVQHLASENLKAAGGSLGLWFYK